MLMVKPLAWSGSLSMRVESLDVGPGEILSKVILGNMVHAVQYTGTHVACSEINSKQIVKILDDECVIPII
jgi:hypothetical protein